MVVGPDGYGWAAQVPGIRFSLFRSCDFNALAALEFCQTLRAMGGNHWWRILDHGQPWHRPAHRAKIAGGAESAAVGAGAALEWSGGLFSVWIVSFCGRDALCLLPGSVHRLWARGQDLSDVYRDPHAAWDCGAVDRGHPGGGHVESECGSQLLVIKFDYGFLPSPSSRR